MAKEQTSKAHKTLTIAGTVLCVILVPILVINLVLIVKSYINQDEVPSIGGKFPLIVLTDSMKTKIDSGDLIICNKAKPEDIKEKDIISFIDPAGNGTSIVTHRVIEVIVKDDGEIFFRTRGDNNNDEDTELVPAKNLVGIYETRVAFVGHIAMFMQSTPGLIVCVVLPIILFVAYDFVRRRAYDKSTQSDTAALLAELEALRAEKAEKEKALANDAESADSTDSQDGGATEP